MVSSQAASRALVMLDWLHSSPGCDVALFLHIMLFIVSLF